MNAILTKILWALPACVICNSIIAQTPETVEPNGIFSGNIGVVSQYIYRGGVENDDLAMQGGLEYAHKSGVTVGYWGSTLDYDPSDDTHGHGFEHDLFVAYGDQINSDWSYKVQATAYVYQNGGTVYADENEHRRTTAFDLLAELAYKDVSFSTTVMLADASFANAGDVYLNAVYSHALAHGFILNTSVGGSIYNSSRDDQLVQTQKDFAFSEARLGLSKALADTGVTASLGYVIGGQDRMGEDFDDHAVFGLNYSF